MPYIMSILINIFPAFLSQLQGIYLWEVIQVTTRKIKAFDILEKIFQFPGWNRMSWYLRINLKMAWSAAAGLVMI